MLMGNETSKYAYQNVNIHTSKGFFPTYNKDKGSFFLIIKKPYCLTINKYSGVHFYNSKIFVLFHLYISALWHTNTISIFTKWLAKYATC